jgi:hypothetical protein
VKAPRLEINFVRSRKEIQLQWPSACLCELEGTPDAADPTGWSGLEIRPVETGNRIGLLLPAVQKYQFYRLKCDLEVVR